MIEFEVAATSKVRPHRILRGDGRVEPVKAITVTENGRALTLRPGRDRLAPEHPWVRQRPDLFIAAYSRDSATRDLLRDALRRAGQTRRAGTRSRLGGRGPSGRRRYQLPTTRPSAEPPWRLH
jgi:hypothetical protein